MNERFEFVIGKDPAFLASGQPVWTTLTLPDLPPAHGRAMAPVYEFVQVNRLPFSLVMPSDDGDDAFEIVLDNYTGELDGKAVLEWLALELGVERDPALPATLGVRLGGDLLKRPDAANVMWLSMAKVTKWLGHPEIARWARDRGV